MKITTNITFHQNKLANSIIFKYTQIVLQFVVLKYHTLNCVTDSFDSLINTEKSLLNQEISTKIEIIKFIIYIVMFIMC